MCQESDELGWASVGEPIDNVVGRADMLIGNKSFPRILKNRRRDEYFVFPVEAERVEI